MSLCKDLGVLNSGNARLWRRLGLGNPYHVAA